MPAQRCSVLDDKRVVKEVGGMIRRRAVNAQT